MVKKLALLALALGLVLSFAGCDNFFLGGDTGTLAIYLADMPVNDVAEVNVTLSKVEVKRDNEWVTINDFEEDDDHDGVFDLLKLRFDEALLGEEYLAPGDYTQIRLIIAAPEAPEDGVPPYEGQESYILKEDDEKIPIFVPSGTQTGLKINHEFSIEADTITELILDVDVRDMLVKAGESGIIILGPTSIKVIDKVISGEITGQVLADDDNDGKVIDDVDVIIKAFKEDDGDDPAAEAVASTEEVNGVPPGSFKLRGLLPGDYNLTVEAEGYKTVTIEKISVLEGETTQLEETIFLEEESNDD